MDDAIHMVTEFLSLLAYKNLVKEWQLSSLPYLVIEPQVKLFAFLVQVLVVFKFCFFPFCPSLIRYLLLGEIPFQD